MENKFVEFLKDENTNDESYELKYYSIKIHKERYNDRFVIIYTKSISKGLEQNNYKTSGYYDAKDNILYNITYEIDDLIVDKNSIIIKNFNSVYSQMFEEIDSKVENYIFQNKEEFRKLGIDKFKEQTDWYRQSNYKDVEAAFIQEKSPIIKINSNKLSFEIRHEDSYENKKLIADYLDNPEKVVNHYFDVIINGRKEELGRELLEYEDKLKHLKDVEENKNEKYDKVYINKNILNAIKDMKVKSLNITINYNDKDLTFKYDYRTFINNLKAADYEGYNYDSSYNKVRSFLKENQIKDSRGYTNTNFAFDHITFITFGKKVLYEKELSKENIELENDDFDLEK